LGSKNVPDRDHGKVHSEWVVEERHDGVYLIERVCLPVVRVHLQDMNAEFVCRAYGACKHVEKQHLAHPLPVGVLINGQLRKNEPVR